ncbi:MAG: hypothetical protein P8Y97_11345 [Candidatus Lokiarchaeota archaeon]
MRKNIFIFTQEPKFFYKLNKRLKSLKLSYRVLSLGEKVPYYPSIILTTEKETKNLPNFHNNKTTIISYKENTDFEVYIFKILKSYQVGNKISKSLMFSIDPGKKFGLIVFLDGYYLYSKTFYDKRTLVENIKLNIEYIKEINLFCPKLIIKIGRGVLNISSFLVEEIFTTISEKDLKVYLINEGKSSKIKLHRLINVLSKHEASALVLALREGISVNRENFKRIISNINSNKISKEKLDIENKDINLLNNNLDAMKEIFLKIVNNEISIRESNALIKSRNLFNNLSH